MIENSYFCLYYNSATGDFVPITDMEIVFEPIEQNQCVNITILNDNLLEDLETFTVFINSSNTSLLSVSQNQATVTITSEDSKLFNVRI